ncbi:hypothetical protein K504DRAFT_471065 [Pleomassaria siparia CBS 279.74]|uniref:RING-type domain-containing protein n=1 Tax=Pleomassaria siparia CBS 279.74 TaxID=1314801 RepID=A0A6G1K1D3_9PLEO|nr:hypothetical protein K504DRAFT_471065 [Pleomassaria siparia CBS 279.74]
MSGYEVEHNISTNEGQPAQPSRRPDLSTFFSTLELVDTSDPQEHTNENALPQPENMSAAFRLLANALEVMRDNAPIQRPEDENVRSSNVEYDLIARMITTLQQTANDPPAELKGCPDSFLDDLERVPKKSLKETDSCPLCLNPFLDDKYPLVVRLPCHKDHRFDFDCIRPWLKLNNSCPFDRKEVYKKKPPPPPPVDDDEEDYDEMYA